MTAKITSLPAGTKISVVGEVLKNGLVDWSVCFVLDNGRRTSFVNQTFPQYNFIKAVEETYSSYVAWLMNEESKHE